jgi:hypothetical protein
LETKGTGDNTGSIPPLETKAKEEIESKKPSIPRKPSLSKKKKKKKADSDEVRVDNCSF